jgi:signal transduction histidine kinase
MHRHAAITAVIAVWMMTVGTRAESFTLTNAAQVRALSSAEAAKKLPVRLRGVVVDISEPRYRALILADNTASIYISSWNTIFANSRPKDVLEIEGVTSAGEFAPCVHINKVIEQNTSGGKIPPARPASYQELITGAMDAQFVEVKGVVREVVPAPKDSTIWKILLAANGGVISVRLPLPQDETLAVDSEVTVQAVCFYQFNNRRQALSPILQVPHDRPVKLDRPAPENPFNGPVQPLASLLQFSSEIPFGHRVHVRGVVTLAQPDYQLWIRDATSGLRIQSRHKGNLKPGDEVDVLGFPAYGASSPVLEDAICQKRGVQTPPVPTAVTNLDDAFNHQDDLVSMEAKLTDLRAVTDGWLLTLEHETTSFKAVLKHSQPPGWQPGSLVRIAGICDVTFDSARPVLGIWHPQSFQLLMRSSEDLTVLRSPSWWTAQHIVMLLSMFMAALIIAGVIAAILARRRLNEQAHNRALAEAEFAAILAERNRLAREIHDTLAQGFTATLLQLQLVRVHAQNGNDAMNPYLEKAEQMIRSGLKEARNSIWQMQPQVLETGDLTGALKNILKQLSEGIVAETHFETTGSERRLPPIIETNILRLGQEAISNAIKHAKAKNVRVLLEFGDEQFRLTVKDDGCGFDPASPPPSEGGFGIVGMQGRAKDMKGDLKIVSAPGKGTEVSLIIPVAQNFNSTRTG